MSKNPPSLVRVWLARSVAIASDFVQILVLPLFLPGAASPWADALDVVVAVSVTWLVGWHWAFLPSFLAELVPGLDLVPTWTAAVFFATRRTGSAASRASVREGAIDTEVVPSYPPVKPR